MRALVQRVSRAEVRVDGAVRGRIEAGFVVLVGVSPADTVALAARLAAKVAALRLFEDSEGRMNLALADVGGAVLAISQFTLYADVRRGNRPSFSGAAPGDVAAPVYDAFCAGIEAAGLRCERGVFGAHMEIDLVNDGPVTVIVDSADLERPRDSKPVT